jgi:hypothetical protein
VIFSRSPSVFSQWLSAHYGGLWGYSKILVVDMDENTWRKIDRPSGLQHSMHQAQGHLCCVYVLLVVPMIPSF